MRTLSLLGLLLFLFFGGCNAYSLRYAATPQPQWANVFADYTPLQGAVGFPIDTDGRRLEEASVRRLDGTLVRPLNIVYPGFAKSAAIGTGIGTGWGVGHHGIIGTGLGIGIPIGPERAQGLTTATFDEQTLGPPPWELHVKLQGIQEAVVPGIGGPPTAK
jgi:hypothetical protein